jgi:hypothetical protein
MVRAILAGTKTQTRRVVKMRAAALAVTGRDGTGDQHLACLDGDLTRAVPDLLFGSTPGLQVPCADGSTWRLPNPWGFPEPVRLWVKETFSVPTPSEAVYRADLRPEDIADERAARRIVRTGGVPWKSPIFMPRWASRITLAVTGVRAERLQSITEEDAQDEGVSREGAAALYTRVGVFGLLWNQINGKRKGCAWVDNPFVWVLTFEVVR